jgi:hypothetical protein
LKIFALCSSWARLGEIFGIFSSLFVGNNTSVEVLSCFFVFGCALLCCGFACTTHTIQKVRMKQHQEIEVIDAESDDDDEPVVIERATKSLPSKKRRLPGYFSDLETLPQQQKQPKLNSSQLPKHSFEREVEVAKVSSL